jgi:hypothetical protein
MKKAITPNEAFDNWYNTYPVGTARTKQMLLDAFMVGARYASTDAIRLMEDYAAATAGLPAELRAAEDMYDIVACDLSEHFSDVLDSGSY